MTIYKVVQEDFLKDKQEKGYFKKRVDALTKIHELKKIDKQLCIGPFKYFIESIQVK